jgi:hypothetical protein
VAKPALQLLAASPPDGFLSPSERFAEAVRPVWSVRDKLASLSLGTSPNVTGGMNIPSGVWGNKNRFVNPPGHWQS